jgi:[ribosomal protein S5]-alanine N-acetyltransferase
VSASRLIRLEDAPVLAKAVQDNRDFLAPWDPVRGEKYFTEEGQRALIADALDRYVHGTTVPYVITDESGQACGRVTLSDIVRGPFRSCHLGYWLAADRNGRGLASAAVADIIRVAFGQCGLHRIEAGTVPHNARSQRVLERNGFVRFGMAPQYLAIAGEWQDHVLYQLLNPDIAPLRAAPSRRYVVRVRPATLPGASPCPRTSTHSGWWSGSAGAWRPAPPAMASACR